MTLTRLEIVLQNLNVGAYKVAVWVPFRGGYQAVGGGYQAVELDPRLPEIDHNEELVIFKLEGHKP